MNLKSFFYRNYQKLKPNRSIYQIGAYEVKIPPNFALPFFQRDLKLYDRFLPVLTKYIDSEKIIIDVGANIGDTAVMLLQKCNNPISVLNRPKYFYLI